MLEYIYRPYVASMCFRQIQGGQTVTDSTTRREAASPFGEWASSGDALMSYRDLASRPRAIDRSPAEGLMQLRPDLRTSAGAVLSAPLTIAMLDVAGINVDR